MKYDYLILLSIQFKLSCKHLNTISSFYQRCIGMIHNKPRRLPFCSKFVDSPDLQSIFARLKKPCPPLSHLLPPGIVRINLEVTEIWCIGLETEEETIVPEARSCVHMHQVQVRPHVPGPVCVIGVLSLWRRTFVIPVNVVIPGPPVRTV